MDKLVIKDLAATQAAGTDSGATRTLTREELRATHGGRAISVLVDGRPGGVVDDFDLQMAIFKGDIGVVVK